MLFSRKKKEPKLNKYIARAAEEAGRDYAEMKALMVKAKEDMDISYSEYANNRYYELSENQQRLNHEKIVRNKERKEALANQVCEKTGWGQEKALEAMTQAKKEYGIGYGEYVEHEFYNLPESEFENRHQTVVAAKAEAEAKKKEANRNAYIRKVVEGTGWTEEHAVEMMDRAYEICGMSYEHYAAYGFWNIEEEIMPEFFTKRDADALRDKYNTNREQLKVFMNKVRFSREFNEFLGRPWIATKDMTLEAFKETFKEQKRVIYKPLQSYGGNGIVVYYMKNPENIYEMLSRKESGIVEGFLKQHPDMQKLSLKSVNTIRVVTILTKEDNPKVEKDKVHFVYMGIRMGAGSSYMDNLHSGGLSAVVDVETGQVMTDGFDFRQTAHQVHPDTKTVIKGFQIPYFKEMKEMIEKAGAGIEGYYGWDIAITEDGPVIIEVNTHPGAGVLQAPFIPQKKGMRYMIEKFL